MSKNKENRLGLKIFTCLIYFLIMVILCICSYQLFKQKQIILPWNQIKSVDEYTYIDISKMSEKFAFHEKKNLGFHFVIEEEKNGLWHTYVIAINEEEYEKYQSIIDYSYERITEKPKSMRVYGYPVIVNDMIKELAIKNISNFLPAENEVEITEENYENYLTNSYLDTTKRKKEKFSITMCLSFLLIFVVFVLMLLTILDKNKKEEGEKNA